MATALLEAISADAIALPGLLPADAEPEVPAEPDEITIAPGEDTVCARCLEFLPAGSPAWEPEPDRILCAFCAGLEG